MTKAGAVFSVAIWLCAITPVSAQGVALLHPPNQTGYGISDPDGNRAFAENFFLLAPTSIEQVVLWGVLSDPDADETFSVLIHEDDGGLPGAIVASVTDLLPIHRSTTGQSIGSLPEYVYYLQLPTAFPLASGTWWVEVFNSTPDPPRSWGWEGADWDPIHGVPGCAIATEAPGLNWSSCNFTRAIVIVGLPQAIFADNFESGDTSAWSQTVP